MGRSPSNLVELLRDRTQHHPDRLAFTFLQDGEREAGQLTYGDLDRQARFLAARLQASLVPWSRAMLVYPYEAGLDFIVAFLGCLYAQVIAVPCHPPRHQQSWLDLQGRLLDAGAAALLTTRSLLPKLQRSWPPGGDRLKTLQWLTTDDRTTSAPQWQPSSPTADYPAFLQYTSGSTGQPKGVVITHGCLWQNQRMLQMAFEHMETAIALSWLPLFHDMGLIGSVLHSLYAGSSGVLMSPIAFVQKPVRWLNAISRYQATTSGAPNFAYDLLCRHVTDDQRDRLDLSSWELAFCGAEPVRETTLNRFADQFQCCGFRKAAFYPCYGMAEATLFVTGGQKAEVPTVLTVAAEALTQNRVIPIAPATATSPSTNTQPGDRDSFQRAPDPASNPLPQRQPIRTQTLVSCGHPWLDTQVMIVHPETGQPCGDREIGEIWISGTGISPGYWQQPDQTADTFGATIATESGTFLRTGDLGFLHHHELFVTGRLQDVMVIWGFNHYPQQIEQTAEACHPCFRANGCAAFTAAIASAAGDSEEEQSEEEQSEEEQLIIVQEVDRYPERVTLAELVETLRWEIFQHHFLDLGAIIWIKPGRLPRTSSGKIQRRRCRQQFLDGSLAVLDEWRSPERHDISSLIQRYLNPVTHLRRYTTRWQGQFGRAWRSRLQ